LKSTDSGYWVEIQENTKQWVVSTEIGSWAKCDDQFKSLTLSKERGDDDWIAQRQFEPLTSTIAHENRTWAIKRLCIYVYITDIDQKDCGDDWWAVMRHFLLL